MGLNGLGGSMSVELIIGIVTVGVALAGVILTACSRAAARHGAAGIAAG